MATCESKLAEGFVRQCGHRPKQGILEKWYINYDDIDQEATQKANLNTKITALVLKATKKIYAAEGNNKTSQARTSFVTGDLVNGYTHVDAFTILYNGEKERQRVQELAEGGRVVTLVKKVDSGLAGELTYEILGLESGMTMTANEWDSAANNGTVSLEVATPEGEEEATGAKLFVMPLATEATDLAETEKWIADNVFVPTP